MELGESHLQCWLLLTTVKNVTTEVNYLRRPGDVMTCPSIQYQHTYHVECGAANKHQKALLVDSYKEKQYRSIAINISLEIQLVARTHTYQGNGLWIGSQADPGDYWIDPSDVAVITRQRQSVHYEAHCIY